MEPWVWLIIGLLVGFVCGYGISVHLRAKTFAGTLREDHSDPTEAPYLFLELEPGGIQPVAVIVGGLGPGSAHRDPELAPQNQLHRGRGAGYHRSHDPRLLLRRPVSRYRRGL